MKVFISVFCLLSSLASFSQIDSSFINRIKALDTANFLKSDTLSAPDDLLTKKIKLLLSEKKGLTVGTILRIKIFVCWWQQTLRPVALT